MAEDIEGKNTSLPELNLEKALEDERQRIAHELHDDTVQRLVAVRLRLEQFSYRLNNSQLLDESQALCEEISEVVKSLRFLVWGMTLPQFNDKTLTVLLNELFQKLDRIAHVKVTFVSHFEHLEFFMEPATKQSLFRMVQEVTQNFVNHSLGFDLTVKVNWQQDLKISIQDNGQGLWKPGGKQDLTSLQKRATDIGAELLIQSPIGHGLCITIIFKKPLQ